MTGTILTLLGTMVLVFIAALIFTNAIEWIASQLKLGCSFVGSIIAPLFTSIPEMVVFLVAVFAFADGAGKDIGVGTIYGQPFMASSLSYGLVGVAILLGFLLKKRTSGHMHVDKSLATPFLFVTILFPLTLVPALTDSVIINYVFAFIFLAAFVYYIWTMYKRKNAEQIDHAEAPYFCRIVPKATKGRMVLAVLQLLVAVGLLYIGSEKMVGTVETLSAGIGLSALALALIIVPAATAIPETSTALIWGFKGRDTLSLGSLVGEKILYSTFYPALALFLISWSYDIHILLSVIATTVISLMLYLCIRFNKLNWYTLCFGLVFFVAYIIIIFVFKI
jgi:cation:H+ antiporter